MMKKHVNWKWHSRFTLPLIMLGLLTLFMTQHANNGVQLIQAADEFPPPVFSADHEDVPCVLDEDNYDKDDRTALDQWEGQGTDGRVTRTGGLSSDDAGESYGNIEAVNEDGDCALKISLFDTEATGRVGRFLYMSNFRHSNPYTPLPSPGYYSVWMKVPENYESDHSWNIFQFQNRVFEQPSVPGLPGVQIDHNGPERMFGVHLLTNEATGDLEFNIVLHDYLTNFLDKAMSAYKDAGYSDNDAYDAAHRFACHLENDTCQKTSYQDYIGALEWLTGSPPSNIPVPIGEWFRLTAYIEESTVENGNIQPDGRFVMWLNNDQILREDSIVTKLHPNGELHWEINSYNSKGKVESPSGRPVELYIDDAQIIEMDVPDNQVPNPPPMPATSTFTDLDLLAPTDGSSVSGQPQLEWRDVQGATRYRVQIQRGDNSERVLLTSRFSASANCSGGRCSYTPDVGLFDNGTAYKWQVEAVNSSNTSEWSSYYQFTFNTVTQPTNTPRPTQTPLPPPMTSTPTATLTKPELLAPENGASVFGQPQLEWRDVPAATRYRIQIQRRDNSERVLLTNRFADSVNCSGGRCSYTPDAALFDNDTEYKWQGEAVDSSNTSKWSSYYRFTFNTVLFDMLFDFDDNPTWRTYNKSNSAIDYSTADDQLTVDYDVPSNEYAAAFIDDLPFRDWRSYRAVQFAFNGRDTGDEITFEIYDNDNEIFQSRFDDNVNGWQTMTLPLNAFARASWQPSGAPNDGLTLSDVQRITFKIGGDNTSINSMFEVDDILLVE